MSRRRRWFDPLGRPGPDRTSGREPVPVGDALRALAARRGWQSHLAAGDLEATWSQVVGPGLAEHTTPLRLRGGVLVLAASSPMWAAEVRQLGMAITERINAQLGAGAVRTITVTVRPAKTP